MLAQILGPILATQPAAGGQAWAFVQACSNQDLDTGTTTCVFSGNVGTGHVVQCFAQVGANSTTFTSANLSGSSPTTMTAIDSQTGTSSQGFSVATSAAGANAGSTATVTVHWSNTPDVGIACAEYSGVSTRDASQNSGAGTGTAIDSGSFTTAHANELCVGGGGVSIAGATFTAGSGFTIRAQKAASGGVVTSAFIEDKNVASIGACDATATGSSSGNWNALNEGYY